MTEEQQTLEAIRAHIASHPDKLMVELTAERLRHWINDTHRGEASKLAISLIGAELAAQS